MDFYCCFLCKSILLYFQANAPRWLCNKAWGCRFLLQWHAAGCQYKLWLQLQEEVSLSVAPADMHPVLHPLHPIHFSEHLTVWLQVCHVIITHSFAGKLCVCVLCSSKSLLCSSVLISCCHLRSFVCVNETFNYWIQMFKIKNILPAENRQKIPLLLSQIMSAVMLRFHGSQRCHLLRCFLPIPSFSSASPSSQLK